MKVLAIMGSPRKKGKGYQIVQKIEDRLKTHDDIDFEYIYLSDQDLEMCRGCFVCVVQGEEQCPIKDGQRDLEERMLSADGIIFCSPVYGHNVSGLMKVFIDRFSYNGHHPRFFKQNALFIANTCGMGIDGALKAMHFIRAWGFHTVCELGLKWPHYKQSEKEIRKNEQLIEQAADKLYLHMSRDESEPQIEQIKQFYIMKTIMTKLKGYENMFPGDLKYWGEKGWLNKETKFFYKTKLMFHHRALGFTISMFFRILMPVMASN